MGIKVLLADKGQSPNWAGKALYSIAILVHGIV
jgi:hypothetical protein